MAAADVRRERVRNRLLRRVDWRFLLPNPSPAKSICFAGGLLAEAVDLISGCAADPLHIDPGDCDLAVFCDPDRATLRAAWAALRPGGSCYGEWSSPLARGPAGIRRRLKATGFEDVTCYWTWPRPSLSRSWFWLPLDAPGALRYFLTNRPPPQGAVRRLAYLARRTIWLLSLRLHLSFPVCAVARKPAAPSRLGAASVGRPPPHIQRRLSAAGAGIFETIRSGWEQWGLSPSPSHLSWFVLTGGYRSINKIVGLVFAEPDPYPALAVKLPRVPESVPGLMREAATLRAVQSLRPGGFRGVPQVLFCQEHNGLLSLGETALTGLPVSTLLRRDNYRHLALAATTWLADLAGHPPPRPRDAWWGRLIEPVLAGFEESFGAVVDGGLLRETRAILDTMAALPIVCEQRDFSPWNVLVSESGGLVVLDWESAELQGLPALDLMYALSYLAFFLDGAMASGRFRESYRMSLDPLTFSGRVREECLVHYVRQTGIDRAALRPLGVLLWLLHSRSEFQRLTEDVAGRPKPEALRSSLFVSLWEEEVRRAGKA